MHAYCTLHCTALLLSKRSVSGFLYVYTELLLFVVYFVMFIVFFTCGILKIDVCNNNDDDDKGDCSYQNKHP